MNRTLLVLGALALAVMVTGSATAWHVTIDTCYGCATSKTITSPEAPWLLPFHPPSPCLGAESVRACADFP